VADSSCCVITTQKRLMLIAGRSNPALAEKIADKLDVTLGKVLIKTFANGEIYARYEENIRGADLFIVQSPLERFNDEVMELLILIQAAKLASSPRSPPTTRTRGRTRRAPPASRSPRASSRRCSRRPAPTAS